MGQQRLAVSLGDRGCNVLSHERSEAIYVLRRGSRRRELGFFAVITGSDQRYDDQGKQPDDAG